VVSVENERERERMSEGSGRQEMERRLIEKSIEDEAFRRRLMEDPKGAVEEELGTRLSEEVRVVAVEETQDTIYLVLPGAPKAGREGGELSDLDLESVAGAGWGDYTDFWYGHSHNADGVNPCA
jgi:Nitrile hydratase, alpha chain